MSSSHVIVMEPEMSGHQREHVRHLAEYCSSSELPLRLTFLLHPRLAEQIIESEWWPSGKRPARIEIAGLTAQEYGRCTHGSFSVRALWRWFTLTKYLREYRADHGLFLHLDHLQLPLAMRLPVPTGASISGILFRPSVHYRRLWGQATRWRERVRDTRKSVMYRRMMRHPALRWVFSLDPYFPGYAQGALAYGSKVRGIPEPSSLPDFGNSPRGRCEISNRIPDDRRCFLLFGALSARKGILKVLDALALLDTQSSKRIAVIFAGRLDRNLAKQFVGRLEGLRAKNKDIWVHLENRFIDEVELVALLRRCDVVLAPYQRFVGSSGVLVWAAGFAKPVITQDYGLLGHLAQAHGLGLAIDTTSPGEIAKSLKHCVENDHRRIGDPDGIRRYAAAQRADEFARIILSSIAEPI